MNLSNSLSSAGPSGGRGYLIHVLSLLWELLVNKILMDQTERAIIMTKAQPGPFVVLTMQEDGVVIQEPQGKDMYKTQQYHFYQLNSANISQYTLCIKCFVGTSDIMVILHKTLHKTSI